jgi:hypothetical protein
MSNEETSTETVVVNQSTKGDRGIVGTASASQTIKQLWHASQKAKGQRLTLKRFARQLLKDGNEVAEEWFKNKAGAKDAGRSEANIALSRTIAAATKLNRKAKK